MAGKVVYSQMSPDNAIAREQKGWGCYDKQNKRLQGPLEFILTKILEALPTSLGLLVTRFAFVCEELPKRAAEYCARKEKEKTELKNNPSEISVRVKRQHTTISIYRVQVENECAGYIRDKQS